jgi:hypothetical protein
MKSIAVILVLLVAKLTLAQEINNQYKLPENREGFNIDIGFGVGYANRVSPLFYDDENIFGTTFASNISYRFNRKIKAGAGFFMWAEAGQIFHDDSPPDEDPNRTRIFLMATGSYYPLRSDKFFIFGGAGGGNFFFTPEHALPLANGDSSLSSAIDVGFAFAAGVGYEIKVGKKCYLVPSVNYYHTFLNDIDVFPGAIENSTPSRIVEFHLSFLFHAKTDD